MRTKLKETRVKFRIDLPDDLPGVYDAEQREYQARVPIRYGEGYYRDAEDALRRFLHRTSGDQSNDGRVFYRRLLENLEKYVKPVGRGNSNTTNPKGARGAIPKTTLQRNSQEDAGCLVSDEGIIHEIATRIANQEPGGVAYNWDSAVEKARSMEPGERDRLFYPQQ